MSYTIPVVAVGWIALGASPHPPYPHNPRVFAISVVWIVSTNNSKYLLQNCIYRKCISGNVCSDTYPL